MTHVGPSARRQDQRHPRDTSTTFVFAALLAMLGPWIVGMSAALLSPNKQWSFGDGGAFFGLIYLAFFGGVAAWLAGSYYLALGAMAGAAFAIGSIARGGGVIGVGLSLAAGLLGGAIARRVASETIGHSGDARPPPPHASLLLLGAGIGLGLPIALLSYGQIAAAVVVAALIYVATVTRFWWLARRWNSWPLTMAATVAVLGLVGVAWEQRQAERDAARVASRDSPLEQVLGLTREDGTTFGEFVRARYAKQMGCPRLAQAEPEYLVAPQGPVAQRGGGSLIFYDILLRPPEEPGCRTTGSFYIAVFAEDVPPKEHGEVLVRDCATRRRMGEVFVERDECPEALSELTPSQFTEGEPAAVDWLADFKADMSP